MPLLAMVRQENGFAVNYYFSGSVQTTTPLGKDLKIETTGNYPVDGKIKMVVSCEREEKFVLRFRKPYWAKNAVITGVDYIEEKGYFVVDKAWKKDEIVFNFSMQLQKEQLNGKTAFIYGPIVLALDEGKGNIDIDKDIYLAESVGRLENPDKDEMLRYRLKRKDGQDLIFVDYSSCGKNWSTSDDKTSVWLTIK
jgi:DUF1680 family protein